jgi:hypothetical protein
MCARARAPSFSPSPLAAITTTSRNFNQNTTKYRLTLYCHGCMLFAIIQCMYERHTTMYVYRIEHPNTGDGPYGESLDDIKLQDRRLLDMGCQHCDRNHPGMWEEFSKTGIDSPRNYYCGFDTIENLKDWFDTWLEILHNNGFELRIYSISKMDCMIGKYQSIFIKSVATLVDSMPIQDIIDLTS